MQVENLLVQQILFFVGIDDFIGYALLLRAQGFQGFVLILCFLAHILAQLRLDASNLIEQVGCVRQTFPKPDQRRRNQGHDLAGNRQELVPQLIVIEKGGKRKVDDQRQAGKGDEGHGQSGAQNRPAD